MLGDAPMFYLLLKAINKHIAQLLKKQVNFSTTLNLFIPIDKKCEQYVRSRMNEL